MTRGVRRTAAVLALVVLALAVATVRVVVAGERALAASDAALAAGDAREAVVQAARAASAYAPGAPHVSVAYARLRALARAAEEHKRNDIALLSWRSIRTASRETRWLVTPHAAEAAEADGEIARLVAREAEEPDERAKIERQQLEALASRDEPHRVWVMVLVLSFAACIAGVLWFARRAAGVSGELDWSAARAPMALTVVGVLLWLLSVWRS